MRMIRTLSLALLLGLVAAGPALAQDGVPPGEGQIADTHLLETSVTGHERFADQTRTELSELLESETVKSIAHERGLDLDRIAAQASTLSDEQASAAAPLVEKAKAAMQQGGTITISVYAIIIILLLLILLT